MMFIKKQLAYMLPFPFAFYLFLSFIYLTFALPSIFHLHISHTLSVCYTYDGQLQAAMTTMS